MTKFKLTPRKTEYTFGVGTLPQVIIGHVQRNEIPQGGLNPETLPVNRYVGIYQRDIWIPESGLSRTEFEKSRNTIYKVTDRLIYSSCHGGKDIANRELISVIIPEREIFPEEDNFKRIFFGDVLLRLAYHKKEGLPNPHEKNSKEALEIAKEFLELARNCKDSKRISKDISKVKPRAPKFSQLAIEKFGLTRDEWYHFITVSGL